MILKWHHLIIIFSMKYCSCLNNCSGLRLHSLASFLYWYFTCFAIWCLYENLYVPCNISFFLIYLYLDILTCIAKMRIFFFPVFTPTIMRGILLVLVLVFLDLRVHLRELRIKGGWLEWLLYVLLNLPVASSPPPPPSLSRLNK